MSWYVLPENDDDRSEVDSNFDDRHYGSSIGYDTRSDGTADTEYSAHSGKSFYGDQQLQLYHPRSETESWVFGPGSTASDNIAQMSAQLVLMDPTEVRELVDKEREEAYNDGLENSSSHSTPTSSRFAEFSKYLSIFLLGKMFGGRALEVAETLGNNAIKVVQYVSSPSSHQTAEDRKDHALALGDELIAPYMTHLHRKARARKQRLTTPPSTGSTGLVGWLTGSQKRPGGPRRRQSVSEPVKGAGNFRPDDSTISDIVKLVEAEIAAKSSSSSSDTKSSTTKPSVKSYFTQLF